MNQAPSRPWRGRASLGAQPNRSAANLTFAEAANLLLVGTTAAEMWK
jgi:hypothetical protein